MYSHDISADHIRGMSGCSVILKMRINANRSLNMQKSAILIKCVCSLSLPSSSASSKIFIFEIHQNIN